jgi:hypothetical protein
MFCFRVHLRAFVVMVYLEVLRCTFPSFHQLNRSGRPEKVIPRFDGISLGLIVPASQNFNTSEGMLRLRSLMVDEDCRLTTCQIFSRQHAPQQNISVNFKIQIFLMSEKILSKFFSDAGFFE